MCQSGSRTAGPDPCGGNRHSGRADRSSARSADRSTSRQARPDFEATAFQNGAFKNVKLSDFKGKWVVLCFYPGDFTFV